MGGGGGGGAGRQTQREVEGGGRRRGDGSFLFHLYSKYLAIDTYTVH